MLEREGEEDVEDSESKEEVDIGNNDWSHTSPHLLYISRGIYLKFRK